MRVRSVAMIAVFDIGGPLAAYYLLRSAVLGPSMVLGAASKVFNDLTTRG